MATNRAFRVLAVASGLLIAALWATQPATADPGRVSVPAIHRATSAAAWVQPARWWWRPRPPVYYYGPPYWYEPYYSYPYFDYSYPYPYYYSVPSRVGYRGERREIYNLGYRDGLTGSPPNYVKGKTPGYKGTYRDAYYAGYYKGQTERYKLGLSKHGKAPAGDEEQGQGDETRDQAHGHHPPTHYEPPSAYEKDTI